MFSSTFTTMALLVTTTLAHMQLNSPAPFGAANNPHRTDPADERLTFPYNCCGRKTEWPCGGYLRLLGTPQGAATASWPAGSQQFWNMSGIGNHYGGSCQVGFSIDQGKTFQVAKSYEGNCPHRHGSNTASGQNFDFHVPADLPTGDVVFAWTWFNREAEFNMNCAAVSITGGSPAAAAAAGGNVIGPSSAKSSMRPPPALSGSPATTPNSTSNSYDSPLRKIKPSTYTTNGCACTCAPNPLAPSRRRAATPQNQPDTPVAAAAATIPYANRPGMLFADVGNGCNSPKTNAELKFPHPGPDVQQGDGEYPLALPIPADKCGY